MNGFCTCGSIRHAIDDEHREVLGRALATAKELRQDDLAEHYRYRLEPCPTATAEGENEVTA